MKGDKIYSYMNKLNVKFCNFLNTLKIVQSLVCGYAGMCEMGGVPLGDFGLMAPYF